MNLQTLFEPWSALFVIAGTAVATLLRCGPRELGATLHCLAGLLRPRFSYMKARASLARQVEHMRHDGVLRAAPAPSNDAEIAEATDALIRHRSIGALIAAHERHREQRQVLRRQALHLLSQAGELAPILGLAGTLVALSRLSGDGVAQNGLMNAIGTAVLTTLYGLLCAHLTIFPLASLLERRAEAEERERQLLIDWLAEQLAPAIPSALRSAAVA